MYAPFMGGASALLGWLIEFFFFFPTLVLGKMEDVYAPVDKTAILVAAHKVVVGMSPPSSLVHLCSVLAVFVTMNYNRWTLETTACASQDR